MSDIVRVNPGASAAEVEPQLRANLERDPKNYKIYIDLGNLLLETGRFQESRAVLGSGLGALSASFEPLMVSPTQQVMDDFKAYLAKIYAMIGAGWHHEGAYAQAIELYQKSLGIKYDSSVALDSSICLERMDNWDEAIKVMEDILEKDPANDFAVIRYHHLVRQMCDWSDYAAREAHFHKALQQRKRYLAVMCGNQAIYDMDDAKVLSVCKFIADAIKQRIKVFHEQRAYDFDRPDKPKIRIGYISSDIHNHATAHLMFGLWGKHNRDEFEIYTYCYSVPDDSYYRERIKQDSDQFLSVLGWTDNAIADRIYEDQIDILVDLKGFTNNHKMEVLALRPAPIIATYLGFPGTTGADFIDYNIVDKIVAPFETAHHYAEKLAYLPDCYQVNSDEQPIAPEKPARADIGLPDEAVVYACFNSPYKLSPDMFDVWLNILQEVPKGILWLYAPKSFTQEHLKKYAAEKGVANRVLFAPHAEKPEHLARLQEADLFLDTLPCNAHTTASDALWAGVPVLTATGKHFASRVATSLLANIGLPELITKDLEEYQKLAIDLGQNPDKISELKKKLADNKKTEPLFDTTKFATNIEALYKKMWENYKAGELPKQLSL